MRNVYESYVPLVRRFLENEITAGRFQTAYLDMFKNESQPFPEAVFEVLDTLFGDVDAFCADPDMLAELDAQNPGFYLDENRLRERVAHAYERLVLLQNNAQNDSQEIKFG